MVIDTYDDEHLRLETQQIWLEWKKDALFFLFFFKKKTFWKNQQKNNRKSRQNLCVIKSVVIATYDDAIATFSNLE